MNPLSQALFEQLKGVLDGLMKRDAQRETEHRAIIKAVEGLTRARTGDSDTHYEVRHDMSTQAEQKVDFARLSGGYIARDVNVLALGTGTLQVRTPDMAEFVTVTATGMLFQNDSLQELIIRESAGGGSGNARFRVGYWTGR